MARRRSRGAAAAVEEVVETPEADVIQPVEEPEPEEPEPAEPEPEEPAEEPEPVAAEAEAAEAEPEEPETDWKAEAERLKADNDVLHERHQGAVKDLIESRRSQTHAQPQYVPPVPVPGVPAGAGPGAQPAASIQSIPVEFGEDGQPIVPASALEALVKQHVAAANPPPDPVVELANAQAYTRQQFAAKDYATRAPVVQRMETAFNELDLAFRARAQETGYQVGPQTSQSDVVGFLESYGVAEAWRQRWPDIAPDAGSMYQFLAAARATEEMPVAGFYYDYVRRTQSPAPAPAAGAPPEASADAASEPAGPTRRLPADKPRSMGERGSSPKGGKLARLDELGEKAGSWTDAEEKEYEQLMEELDG